jgi:hypothetical protein
MYKNKNKDKTKIKKYKNKKRVVLKNTRVVVSSIVGVSHPLNEACKNNTCGGG